jgi:hypothetical protein
MRTIIFLLFICAIAITHYTTRLVDEANHYKEVKELRHQIAIRDSVNQINIANHIHDSISIASSPSVFVYAPKKQRSR